MWPLSSVEPNADGLGDPPVFKFRLPGDGGYQEYGFYAPSVTFWVHTLGLVAVNAFAAAALAVIIKRYIIDCRPSQQGKQKHRATTSSCLLGYGVLLPAVATYPFFILSALGVQSKLLKFAGGCIVPTLAMFRISEATHGFEPAHATQTTGTYLLYFASPLELIYDPKKNEAMNSNAADLQLHLIRFVATYLMMSAYLSFLVPLNFEPFPSSYADEEWYSLGRLFDLAQLGNNFFHALLFQLNLTCFLEGLATLTSVLGYQTQEVMHNPVLSATSPSQFWGRKWNMLVHSALKRGVFKPVIKCWPKAAAVIMTFLASGVLHEWIVVVALSPDKNDLDDQYEPKLGGSTLFFLWSAVVIILEVAIGHWRMFALMNNVLPRPMITMCVIMLALPLAHWFSDPYIKSGFFADVQVGFALVLPIQ